MERIIYAQSTGEGTQPADTPLAAVTLPIPTTRDAPNAHGQEIAVEKSPYAPDKLILYHTSLGLIKTLQKRGVITRDDYRKAVRILTERYGFPPNSIFAEWA